MAGEKTEKATPKKRRDERKKGHTFSSKDVVTAAFLLIVFYSLKALAPFILVTLQEFFKQVFTLQVKGGYAMSLESGLKALQIGALNVGMVSMPLLLISAAVSIVFSGMQTRFLVSMESMKFKMNRLNPLEGLKKMVSLKSVVEVLKNLIKIMVIGYILYNEFFKRMPEYPKLMNFDILQSLAYIGDSVLSTVTTIGLIFIVVGGMDYVYQWWDFEKNMKMSKDEIKQEYKQLEGDPQIKGKIKQKQREMSQQRMMQEVPTADVVIRNPTHYAIALKYDPKLSPAPVVVAMGQDLIALKIIGIAEEHQVKCIEDRPLARGLYEACKLGFDIPAEFYAPVATIFALLFESKKKMGL